MLLLIYTIIIPAFITFITTDGERFADLHIHKFMVCDNFVVGLFKIYGNANVELNTQHVKHIIFYGAFMVIPEALIFVRCGGVTAGVTYEFHI